MFIRLKEALVGEPGDYLFVKGETVRVVKGEVMELAQELADLGRTPKEEVKAENFPGVNAAIQKRNSAVAEEKEPKFHYSKERKIPPMEELFDRRESLVLALASFTPPATAKQLCSYAYGPKVTPRLEQAFANDLQALRVLGVVDAKQTIEHGRPINWYKLKPGEDAETALKKLMGLRYERAKQRRDQKKGEQK